MNCSEFKERTLHCVKVSYSQMFNSRSKKIPLLIIFAVLISSLIFSAEAIPQVTSSSINTCSNGVNTITMPAAVGSYYLYGYGTGGSYSSSGFANGPYATVTNTFNGGQTVAALAYSTTNSNSFTTNNQNNVIGGAEVSGFNSIDKFYGTNPNPGTSGSVIVPFWVSNDNSLVVVIAIAGDGTKSNLNINGLSNYHTDAEVNDKIGMTIFDKTLNKGTNYYVSETTKSKPGQSSKAGDIIGVWVFQPQFTIVPIHFSCGCSANCFPPPSNLCLPSCWCF